MNTYDVALIVSIPADTYEEALNAAGHIAAGLGDTEELSVSAVLDYEYDNEGQRVLYLHNDGSYEEAMPYDHFNE